MTRYSVQPRDRIFVKRYELLSFAINPYPFTNILGWTECLVIFIFYTFINN